jgi:hypothetical protein
MELAQILARQQPQVNLAVSLGEATLEIPEHS